MATMGLFGLPFPEHYGGMGAGPLALPIALEELARVDSSVAITLEAAISLSAMLIFRFGTEDQRQLYLPSLASGEKLAAFALTEPGGGSDAAALRTVARREGNEYVLNGTKAFITKFRDRHHVSFDRRCRDRRATKRAPGDLLVHSPGRHSGAVGG